MDSVRRKVEKATQVGKSLVKLLIPHGDAYIKYVHEGVSADKSTIFRLAQYKVKDNELWANQNPRLLEVCNFLATGCLYSSLQHANTHLDKSTYMRIQGYLETNFFNILDDVEAVPRGPKR